LAPATHLFQEAIDIALRSARSAHRRLLISALGGLATLDRSFFFIAAQKVIDDIDQHDNNRNDPFQVHASPPH
jgi:hypothetical protein